MQFGTRHKSRERILSILEVNIMPKFKLENLNELTGDMSLRERTLLRYKYFDKEGYRQLSDILYASQYVARRDVYMLAEYITNTRNTDKLNADMIRQHKNDPDINWDAIYDYMDERRKADNWLKGDQEYCDQLFAILEKELRNQNTFCLY